jgi:exodeoxyribonuclease VII small subunit
MTDPTDFEQALTELDAIVRSLEQGDQPLEQSLALFERGVTLSRFCHEKLTDAEKRIQVLTQSGGLRDETTAFEKDPSPGQSDRG